MIKSISKKYNDIDKKIGKIFKKISTRFSLKNFNLPVFLTFTIIFILLWFQHDVISMYFDDFGNASLSYAYHTPGVIGTNYGISHLFEWASFIYQNWGGRILYAITLIIPLLKTGISAFMSVQTIVITLIFYFIYKIVYLYTGKKQILVPIILFILYTLIDMVYLRHGIYWASASILYIWPILPFFALIYFYTKTSMKLKSGQKINYFITIPLLVFLTFITTFSQEQIGIAVIAYLIFYFLFDHIKEYKKHLKIDLPIFITSIISYLFLFLAPGNWVRMDSTEFSNYSFFEKIFNNYPEIIKNIFKDEMKIFLYILTPIIFYMVIKLVYKKVIKEKKNNYKWLLLIIPILLILFGVTKLLAPYVGVEYARILLTILGTGWLICMFITSIFYFLDNKNLSVCAIMIASIASIFCLLLSPTVGGRTGLPFIFFLFLIIALLVTDIYNNKGVILKIIVIVSFVYLGYKGINNYIAIYHGYRNNKELNDYNFELLKKYDKNSENKEINLYKNRITWYGTTRSYEEPSMDFWIKEYFNIPQDVEFKWIDIYNKVR